MSGERAGDSKVATDRRSLIAPSHQLSPGGRGECHTYLESDAPDIMALVGSDAQQMMAVAKSAYFTTDNLLFFGRLAESTSHWAFGNKVDKLRVTGSPDSAAAGLSFGHHRGRRTDQLSRVDRLVRLLSGGIGVYHRPQNDDRRSAPRAEIKMPMLRTRSPSGLASSLSSFRPSNSVSSLLLEEKARMWPQ